MHSVPLCQQGTSWPEDVRRHCCSPLMAHSWALLLSGALLVAPYNFTTTVRGNKHKRRPSVWKSCNDNYMRLIYWRRRYEYASCKMWLGCRPQFAGSVQGAKVSSKDLISDLHVGSVHLIESICYRANYLPKQHISGSSHQCTMLRIGMVRQGRYQSVTAD